MRPPSYSNIEGEFVRSSPLELRNRSHSDHPLSRRFCVLGRKRRAYPNVGSLRSDRLPGCARWSVVSSKVCARLVELCLDFQLRCPPGRKDLSCGSNLLKGPFGAHELSPFPGLESATPFRRSRGLPRPMRIRRCAETSHSQRTATDTPTTKISQLRMSIRRPFEREPFAQQPPVEMQSAGHLPTLGLRAQLTCAAQAVSVAWSLLRLA